MGSGFKMLGYRGLLVLLLLVCWVGSASAAPSPTVQTAWGNTSGFTLLGDVLDDPIFELSGETSLFVLEELPESDLNGYGVYFRADSELYPNVVDARVTLDAGSNLTVIFAQDDADIDLTGILMDGFDSAHVNILGGSSIIVDAQGEDAESAGVVLTNISHPMTAQIVLDEGSSVVATAVAIGEDADAYSIGVVLEDDVHVVVSLDNESSIHASAQATTAASEDSDSSRADAEAYGVYAEADLVEIVLSGASQVNATATSTYDVDDIDGYSGATSFGINAYGETVIVDLSEGSSVVASATAVESAESYGIYVDSEDHSEITLGNASTVSSTATVTGDEGEAVSVGGYISSEGDDTAILTLNNSSAISAEATGSFALAFGAFAEDSPHAVVSMTTGSSISAESTAVSVGVPGANGGNAEADAISAALVVYDNNLVEIDIDSATISATMSATATVTQIDEGDEGDAWAVIGGYGDPFGGLIVEDYASADINLTDTAVNVIATATASSTEGGSYAGWDADNGGEDDGDWLSGIMVAEHDGESITTIDLLRTVVDVDYSATAADEANALAFGITLIDSGATELQLQDSVVNVTAMATATADEGSSMVDAFGIYAVIESDGGLISLDNSIVNVQALSATAASEGIAGGIGAFMGEYEINITNGSQVSAVQSAGMEGLFGDDSGGSMAIFAGDADVDITIDSSSSLYGGWAVYADDGDAFVDNSGLIAGRLLVNTFNNAATGILQATFGSADGFAYPGGEGSDFYFMTREATLADGTTFHIVPTDDLGILGEDTSASFALLVADGEGGGTWIEEQLNLTAASPVLGLGWSEDSDDNQLIVTLTRLTAAEAGLSSNETAAYEAALADGLFVWDSNPEEWVPNVSGAFVSGMTQSLGISQLGIGNRMGALMGMNSGDEIVANNGMWLSVRYTDVDQDERDNIVGFDADTTGFSIGMDREYGAAVLGFAYTLGSTEADVDDNSAQFDMTDHLLSLYGSYDSGAWYTEAIFSVGFGDVEGERVVGSDVYKSDYDNTSYNAKIEMGMKLNPQGWQINPIVALLYSTKDYDSYNETGSGGLALHVQSQDYDVFTAGVGAVVQKDFQCSWGTITPEISGMVNYDITNDEIVTTANYLGGSTSFVSAGSDPADSSWDLGAALTFAGSSAQNISLRLGYDYSGRQDFEAHSFTGKLRFEF